MRRNATVRILARANRSTVAVNELTEDGAVTVRIPARRPSRSAVNRAAVWASANGWDL